MTTICDVCPNPLYCTSIGDCQNSVFAYGSGYYTPTGTTGPAAIEEPARPSEVREAAVFDFKAIAQAMKDWPKRD